MTTSTITYRYQLPKKAIKGDCPDCAPKQRKTLSRYVDSQTSDPLPEQYGRCDRESNCGYHLSPYHKGASGLSYAEEMNPRTQAEPIPKSWFRMAGKWKKNGCTRESVVTGFQDALVGATPEQAEQVAAFIFDKPKLRAANSQTPDLIYCIPDEVFKASLTHYENNRFAQLLNQEFGQDKADQLLNLFQIGTSSRWLGATVFWLIDEQGRARGGQLVLFKDDWHKARYTDREGNEKVCISSVSHGLLRRYRQQQQTPPDWLTDYHDNAPRWPLLFGLHQLTTAPIDQPIAIVEAPKTAVIGAALIPEFIWMAIGALSYLNADRLAPLKGRSIMLFPDLSIEGSAFARWNQVANTLRTQGFIIDISTILEESATEGQRTKGYDLADFLLNSNYPDVEIKEEDIEQRIEVIGTNGSEITVTEENSRIKLPYLIESMWQQFSRPPLWFNLIAAHKAVLRCLEPEEPLPEIPLTKGPINARFAPDESQLERLQVDPVVSYPAEWDEPSPSDAVPKLKQQLAADYFQWQRTYPPFNHLGKASLQTKQPQLPWREITPQL